MTDGVAVESRPPEVLDLRRHKAMAVDASTAVPADLGAVWVALTGGELGLADAFTSGNRSYLILRMPRERKRPPRSFARKLLAVESALTGVGLKAGSHALHCSESSVVHHVRDVFEFMGCSCRFGRTPPLLIMAACAARSRRTAPARRSELTDASGTLIVVSIARLDLAAGSLFAPKERATVRLLIDGESHEEIARARGRSVRTIANQLGAVFRKLKVSGRLELIRRLADLSAEPRQRAAAHSPEAVVGWTKSGSV